MAIEAVIPNTASDLHMVCAAASEIGAHARRVLVVMTLDKRAFCERVDFVTTSGRRVQRVITDKCILDRDESCGELVLSALFPGVSESDIRANVGWELRSAKNVSQLAGPSAETTKTLQLLRAAQ